VALVDQVVQVVAEKVMVVEVEVLEHQDKEIQVVMEQMA
jgi:hypothetical protein